VKPEGPQTHEEQDVHASNVVRLPRDWLGPRDELVPFGAGAAEPPAPPSANDFWGEDSAAMHDAVQGPSPESGADGAEAVPGTTPSGPEDAVAPPGAADRWTANGRAGTSAGAYLGRRWANRTAALIVASALGVAGVAFFVQMLSGGSGTSVIHRIIDARNPAIRIRPTGNAGLFPSHRFIAKPVRHIRHQAVRRSAPKAHAAAGQPDTGSSAATSSSNYTAGVQVAASSPSTSSPAPANVASTEPTHSSASASPQPFGLSGSLGPGHSPNG
jgi:hypothetical protein